MCFIHLNIKFNFVNAQLYLTIQKLFSFVCCFLVFRFELPFLPYLLGFKAHIYNDLIEYNWIGQTIITQCVTHILIIFTWFLFSLFLFYVTSFPNRYNWHFQVLPETKIGENNKNLINIEYQKLTNQRKMPLLFWSSVHTSISLGVSELTLFCWWKQIVCLFIESLRTMKMCTTVHMPTETNASCIRRAIIQKAFIKHIWIVMRSPFFWYKYEINVCWCAEQCKFMFDCLSSTLLLIYTFSRWTLLYILCITLQHF